MFGPPAGRNAVCGYEHVRVAQTVNGTINGHVVSTHLRRRAEHDVGHRRTDRKNNDALDMRAEAGQLTDAAPGAVRANRTHLRSRFTTAL